MLTLDKDSQIIVTDENFSVKIKCVNPACFMNEIPGDVGLGLEISVNEHTRLTFGNPERFEKFVSSQDRKFSGMSLRFNGALFMYGTLVITNATSETYSGWLQSELGALGTKQRDKFIIEESLPVNQTFVNKQWLAYSPETDDYACVPIKNLDFWEGKGIQVPETFSTTDPGGKVISKEELVYRHSQYFRNEKDNYVNRELGMLIDTEGYSVVVSPFLFLQVAIRKILHANGFFIDTDANFLTNAALNRLVIYNTYNLMWQSFTTTIEGPYVQWDPMLKQWVFISRKVVTDTQWYLGTFEYTSLLPKISLKDFVLGIQNWQNIIFVFGKDNKVKVIDRNAIVESPAYSLDAYFIGSWVMGEKKDTILKFTQEIDSNDANFGENWHDLSDRRNDYGAPVDSFVQLNALTGELGELRLVRDEARIYEYTWATDLIQVAETWEERTLDVLVWKPASIMPQPFFYGTSETDEIEEIKTSVAPLVTPVRQTGNIKSMKSLWSDFKLRCLYQPNGENAGFDTIFDGDQGVFERRWRKWAQFWRSRQTVEGEFMLPLNELIYITSNITQPYSTRHGWFIIEELECDFKGSQMSTVKIKGYKL